MKSLTIKAAQRLLGCSGPSARRLLRTLNIPFKYEQRGGGCEQCVIQESSLSDMRRVLEHTRRNRMVLTADLVKDAGVSRRRLLVLYRRQFGEPVYLKLNSGGGVFLLLKQHWQKIKALCEADSVVRREAYRKAMRGGSDAVNRRSIERQLAEAQAQDRRVLERFEQEKGFRPNLIACRCHFGWTVERARRVIEGLRP